MQKLNWDKAVFFFDVDDTLIDTATISVPASQAIFESLSKEVSEDQAHAIQARFNRIFQTLMQGHMAKTQEDWDKIEGGKEYHDVLLERIKILQEPIIDTYGTIKKWSREVFLTMAAEDYNEQFAAEFIYSTIDAHWDLLSQLSQPMPGVLDLFQKIKAHNRPVYIITSSDARLQINNEGLFTYDPKHSEAFKKKRMERLKSKGIIFNQASIGDPEDKPYPEFFEKGIRITEQDLGQTIETQHIIMSGDSYAGDLQTPREKLGFGLVVLYKKGQQEVIEEGEKYISTGNLSAIINYLE